MEEIVDTNVIIRFLVRDHEAHHRQAKKWFRQAEQEKRKLVITPVVVGECCFVLESVYKLKTDNIANTFESFLSQKWLKVWDKKALLFLWASYRKGLHFVDSYLIASAVSQGLGILSFDKQLLKQKRKI